MANAILNFHFCFWNPFLMTSHSGVLLLVGDNQFSDNYFHITCGRMRGGDGESI